MDKTASLRSSSLYLDRVKVLVFYVLSLSLALISPKKLDSIFSYLV